LYQQTKTNLSIMANKYTLQYRQLSNNEIITSEILTSIDSVFTMLENLVGFTFEVKVNTFKQVTPTCGRLISTEIHAIGDFDKVHV